MSDELPGQLIREMTNTVKEVVREGKKHLSNAAAEATGRHLESEARTEQHDLESLDVSPDVHDWYEPGDAQSLPLEAQSDSPWPFGRPDLPNTTG